MWLNRLRSQRITLPVKQSPKLHRRKRGKPMLKSLWKLFFDKFNQFSNDEFLRYSTVTLITVQ